MTQQDSNIAKEPAAEYSKQYTYADYMKFEYDHMVELIKGKIFKMSPAPKLYHQQISMSLSAAIFQHFVSKNCQVLSAPTDVILPIRNQKKNKATTVVQPDILIVCDPSKLVSEGCLGAPDFIVEILSDSTAKKDMNDKYQVYEESGVREYWIVMPKEQLVEVFHLENGKYNRVKTYTSDEMISPVIFPDLKINLDEVFPEMK